MKKRLFFLTVGGFLVSILPLLIVVIANREQYVRSVPDAVKLGFGGVVVSVMLVMKVFGALRIKNGTSVVLIVLILSILLERVLDDLTILCAAYLIGDLINVLFFKRKIQIYKEVMARNKQADEIEDRTRRVMDEYLGNGRT
jgi:hypothetical protein